jgi:hypothetical protein
MHANDNVSARVIHGTKSNWISILF